MTAPVFSSLLFCGMLLRTIGSESEPSSTSNVQDSITSLQQKVLQLETSVASIPQTMQAEYEQLLITVLDEMEIKLEQYASTNKVSEMWEALQALLSNQSQLVGQSLRNLTLQINRLSSQMENMQSSMACAGEPPSIQNGRIIDFERRHGSDVGYQCDQNFILTGNSTIRCISGRWLGQLPNCSKDGQRTIHSTIFSDSISALFVNSFTLRVHLDLFNSVCNVSCSSRDDSHKIEFTRFLDTGTGGDLPRGARTYTRGNAAVLDLFGVEHSDRAGVYHCGLESDGKRWGIPFLIQKDGAFRRPSVLNFGGRMGMGAPSSDHPSWRWLLNGERIPAQDGIARLWIDSEKKGIYEVYKEGERRGNQVFWRIISRACETNLFGERCDQECPPCYNGGTCHDLLGICVCPPGFHGDSCEVACGEERFGPNCSESCDGGDCKRQIVCKFDPFGCSCAPGYTRVYCTQKCRMGTFGADCKQRCRCAVGQCNPYTGACSGGCSPGWTGQSCQIPVGN